MARRKQPSLVLSCPISRMPKWWPELAREAGIHVAKATAFECENCGQRESISLPCDSSTSRSSDSNLPISLIIPPTLSTLPTNATSSSLPTRTLPKDTFSSRSESLAIESQGRLWEVDKILQKRTIRGRGMHAKRARRYLVQWTPSWLSTREFHYAQKTWKIIKTSQDKHAGSGGALGHPEIRVHWAPSWVSSLELATTLET